MKKMREGIRDKNSLSLVDINWLSILIRFFEVG